MVVIGFKALLVTVSFFVIGPLRATEGRAVR
jgi:hypothetical protein